MVKWFYQGICVRCGHKHEVVIIDQTGSARPWDHTSVECACTFGEQGRHHPVRLDYIGPIL